MKKIMLAILFSLIGFVIFGQSLKVVIKQDDKVIEPLNKVYNLKKKAFQFEISATDLEGFLLGITADETLYKTASGSYNSEIQWFQNMGMSEKLFNRDQELYLMDFAPSYWYYTNKNDHRFDKNPKETKNQWIATRTIKRLYNLMTAEPIDFKNIEENGSVHILIYDLIYNNEFEVIGKKNLFNGELHFKD